eukprot:COSAG02_NODE_2665_length_8297_cov_2.943157_3_plen_60_part_00
MAKKAQQAKEDRQKDAKLVVPLAAPTPPLLRVATHTPDTVGVTPTHALSSKMYFLTCPG